MQPLQQKRAGQLATLTLLALARAQAGEAVPTALENVDVVEHLGAQVPLDLVFTGPLGERVGLHHYFNHGRPVILALAYYQCPMLCSLVEGGLARALREENQVPGRDIDLLTVSFDPTDTPAAALTKQKETLSMLARRAQAGSGPPGSSGSPGSSGFGQWPFLVGEPEAIRSLTEAVGFRYNYLPSVKQYAHDAVLFVLTPDGRVSRYLYGVKPSGRDLRLALSEAREGRSGISFERVLLSCFRWNPASRSYHFYVFGFLRLGALLVFFALLGLVLVCIRRERRMSCAPEDELTRRRKGRSS